MGKIWSFFFSYKLNQKIKIIKVRIYSGWISNNFKSFGANSAVENLYLVGGKNITIGDNSIIGTRSILTVWENEGIQNHIPEITIGNNVYIGDDCHITAINKIEIKNNVLIGKKVTITDNSHGTIDYKSFSIHPKLRPLHSKGAVIIEEGVWIGDKVSIMPNVHIGKNVIVGANSVVTKDVPDNCIIGGIPAKIIKELKNNI